MWKATATLDQKAINDNSEKKDDDDWDSDPNFVNAISEKDQRWGRQETIPKEPVDADKEPVTMQDLRAQVVQSDKEIKNRNWNEKAESVKKSYQTPTKIK